MKTKAQIRDIMKKERATLLPHERKIYCHLIRDNLFSSKVYHDSTFIFSFLSFHKEVDTWEIIAKARKDGKRIFSPRVEAKNLEFYEFTENTTLIKNGMGIQEPEVNENTRYDISKFVESLDSNHVNLMLLPGLAFDLYGNRIGYGAGYYDRYLARFPKNHFLKVGMSYDFQILEQIEAEAYDVKADMILTPTRMTPCMSESDS